MTKSVDHLIRENIKKLIPYSSARSEYKQAEGIFLDANENPYGKYNRYPDPFQLKLKDKLAKVKNIRPEQIFLTNGSDGIVDITYRVFCEPGVDKALTFPPTFAMYTVASHLNNVELITVPLDENFQIDRPALEKHIDDEKLKVIFLCSPNNPTGNHLKREDIDYILENFKGITVIDEAYIDFNNRISYAQKLDKYPRLVVLQTLSKSWALAGARIGMALMSKTLVSYFNKIKTPYNVSSIDQQVAMDALSDQEIFQERMITILSEKNRVLESLKSSPLIKKIYPSDTNFLLVEVEDGEDFYLKLLQHNIIVRNQNKTIKNALRITIGKPEENDKLLQVLSKIENSASIVSQ
ncbi:MAG TPA: histidinol-phosphate transaminase [Flavobacteriaceae bacterium]|nr:histidinol-phosphate transaminase [Flavobacteriaceae bacterium]